MNIEIKIDEITLATVVADVVDFDEDGDPVSAGKERTVADLVAAQIAKQVTADRRYPALLDRVTSIRDEEIRAAIRPAIEQAVARPIKKTNHYGEATGGETTLTEVIVSTAREYLKEPVDKYSRDKGTVLTAAVRTAVRQAFEAEIADAVKQARDLVAGEIGTAVAAQIETAVKAGLKAK